MKPIYRMPLVMALFIANTAFAADEIHYTVTGQNSVTFDWRGTATENSIGYGLTPGEYTTVTAKNPNPVPVATAGTFWEAKLEGLKENAVYYYSIGNGAERTFKTPPARGSANFTIYAQGNIGDTTNFFNSGVIQDLIADGKPSFVVGLGDLTLGSKNGKEAIDQHFNDVMAWSKEAAYMPVWGDLEWRKSKYDTFANYKGRFDVPNPQTSPGAILAGGEDWYWFDYGDTRFITLPEPWAGAWAAWQQQAEALMNQAEADPNIKFIVTFGHQAAYSSGPYQGSTKLRAILDKLGDSYSKYVLNVSAHSGNYERSHPQHGVVHISAGTGGAALLQDGPCLWQVCAKPEWSAYRAMHLGVLKLAFSASAIDGSFICGPSGSGKNDIKCSTGSAVDSFKINIPVILTEKGKQTTGNVPAVDEKAAKNSKKGKKRKGRKGRAKAAATCTLTALSTSTASSYGGFSYLIRRSFGTPADNSTFPTRSLLRLFENGVELKPAHALHVDISNIGRGRFSHKANVDGTGEALRFSASDNTNVKTNGKKYAYCVSNPGAPLAGTTTPTPAPAPAPAPSTTPAPATTSCAPAPTSSVVVNVKDKGAKGNGSTNDTAAIQAAVTQVAAGGTVLIPAGVYLIDAIQHVYLKSNLTLRLASGAELKAIPNNRNNSEVLRLENVSKVNVIGGTIRGERYGHQGTTGQWGHGLGVYNSNNVFIDGVTARDAWGDGFLIGSNSYTVTVCNVTADNNRRQGLSILSGNGIIVKNSVFKNSNGHYPSSGIDIEPDAIGTDYVASNVQILNSQFTGNHGDGVQMVVRQDLTGVAFIKNVVVDGNTIDNNGITGKYSAGVYITNTNHNHRITNNRITNNKQDGVMFANGTSNHVVTGNTISGSGNPVDFNIGYGILIYGNSTNNTVSNNTFSANRKANILDEGGNKISANIFK